MKRSIWSLVAAVALTVPAVSFAQDKPAEKPAENKPAEGGQARPGGGGGGDRPQRGGGGERGRQFGGPGGGFAAFGQRDGLQDTVSVLGELNLAPDFSLTSEQKEKIQTAREDYRKAMEKWQADNKAELDKVQASFREIRENAQGGNGGDGVREKMQEVMKQAQDLRATAPKSDEAIAAIKGVLTTDQLKKFEAKAAERAERRGPGGGFGDRQGGQRQRGGNRGGGAGGI